MKIKRIVLSVLFITAILISSAQQNVLIYYSDFAGINLNKENPGFVNAYKVFVVNKNKCISYLSDSVNFNNYKNKEIRLIDKNKKQYSVLLPPYNTDKVWKKYCKNKYEILYTDSSKSIQNYNCKQAIIKTDKSNITIWFTNEIGETSWVLNDLFCEIPGTIVLAETKNKILYKLIKVGSFSDFNIEQKIFNEFNF